MIEKFTKLQKRAAQKCETRVDVIEVIKLLILSISEEDNENMRITLRISINIFLDRLEEIQKHGGKEGGRE